MACQKKKNYKQINQSYHMQTKSKLKSKKTSELLVQNPSTLSLNPFNLGTQPQEFVQFGAICGDGTFTQKTGKGAGSHHDGIRHKLYAIKSDIESNGGKVGISSKMTSSSSISSSFTCSKCSFSASTNYPKQVQQQAQKLSPSSSQKKQSKKKTILKDLFKTKTKKSALYLKFNTIFQSTFKEELQIVEEEINENNDLWLLVGAICNLYDQMQDGLGLIKELEKKLEEEKNKTQQTGKQGQKLLSTKEKQTKKGDSQQIPLMQKQLDSIKKQNQSLAKQIQKLTKSNSQISESLLFYKQKEKNFKKMLKVIEKQNPKILNSALEECKFDIRDLTCKQLLLSQQSNVVTRSMKLKENDLTKKQKQKESNIKEKQKKVGSAFSSDQSSEFYDEDNTILNIIKSMKQK